MSADQSVIHDIGYQRYEGARLGRGQRVWALYAHALRTAFGLGRTAKAKIFPWAVVGIIGMIAAVLVVVRSQGGEVVPYSDFVDSLTLLLVLFVAIVAPELVSRDLRAGVLPLYFSRPLERSDYPVAKLAALSTAVFLPVAGAMLLMFTGAAFGVDRIGQVWDEVLDLLPGLAYTAVYAVVFAAVALLVASLAGRRAVAAGAIVAVFLLTTPVVGVLSVVGDESVRQLAPAASPLTLVGGVGDWLFDPESPGGLEVGDFGPVYGLITVGLVAGCVLLLLLRYRRVAR